MKGCFIKTFFKNVFVTKCVDSYLGNALQRMVRQRQPDQRNANVVVLPEHIQKTYSKNTTIKKCKILFDVIININEWQSSINNKLKLIRTEV